ncbi:hypothetical protein AALM74_16690 [Parabacteroides segnis]|uniref:hypothetical protein n=1 Tax=Parabacteroides segnis TaxID=2763058 RepID=UPI003512EF0A
MKNKYSILIALVICCSLIISKCVIQTSLKDKKEEIREKYLAGYYDNTEPEGIGIKPQKTEPFLPPDDWVNYEIKDAISFWVPSTVEWRTREELHANELGSANRQGQKINTKNTNRLIFQQKGLSTKNSDALKTYCRIIVSFEKDSKGDFLKATDCEDLSLEDIRYFQELAKQNTSGYNILGKPDVRWIRIGDVYCIEVEYVRTGENDMHTCVYMYYFFNNDKAAFITLAYRREDSEKWKDDFSKIIQTIKWLN